MSFEEEFDRIIRDKAEGVNHPFSEENWQKASQLIDADRRSNGAGFSLSKYLVPGLAVVLLTGLGLTTAFLINDTKSEQQSEPIATVKPVAEPLQQNEINKQVTIPSQDLSPATNIEKRNASHSTNQGDSKSAVVNNMLKGNETANTTGSSGNDKTPPNQTNLISKGLIPNIETIPLPSQSNENNEGSAVTANLATKDEGTERSEISIDQLIGFHLTLNPENSTDRTINPGIRFLNTYEEDYYKKGVKLNKYFVDLELGGSYLFGWNNQGATDAKGLNWFAGVNGGYFLCDKFALGTGVQMYSVKNIKEEFYSVTQTDYSFGSTQSQTVITSHALLYLAVPVKLYFALEQDYLMGVGVNAGYLIRSDNSIETFQLSDGAKTPSSEPVQTNCVYEGMNTMNLMLSASILKKINKRLSVQAEFNYGLSDIFINMNSNNSMQNTTGVRLGLNYRILSK